MKPLDIKEWAESLLLGEHGDYAKEVLELIDIGDCYDEQNDWIEEVTKTVPDDVMDRGGQKTLEWVADQLSMLNNIEKRLEKSFFNDPALSIYENLHFALSDFDCAESALERCGFTEGALTDKVMAALQKLPEPDSADGSHDDIWQAGYEAAKKEFAPKPLEYDL